MVYRYYYDGAGRLNKVIDTQDNERSFKYNYRSNVTKFEESIGGTNYTTDYQYDLDSRTTEILFNNQSSKVLYNYNV